MIKYALNNDLTKLKDAGYLVAKERCIKNIGLKLKEVYLNLYNKKEMKKLNKLFFNVIFIIVVGV